MLPNARSPYRDYAHLLVRPIAEVRPYRLYVSKGLWVKPGDVSGEGIVILGPFPNIGEALPEVVRHDVLGVSDEDRTVTDPWIARDVFDHLGVVVGGEVPLSLASIGHREPPDEVREPRIGSALLFGILVKVVVELPCFVADPQVIALVGHDVM